jgi:hypothetical protein
MVLALFWRKIMDFKDLDKYFNDVDEPNKEIFDTLTTSDELHYIVENHNWDNGITVLKWIIKSKLCSEATALMIFGLAQPHEYTKYNYNSKNIKNIDMDIFNLIKTIMENYKKGFYKKTLIKYNPEDDMPKNENIPGIMYQETNGEEPYIYYDVEEVKSWFGEYLKNEIAKCNDSMELYNIAYLTEYRNLLDNYKNILDHKYCDKGIALLIYWKLKPFYVFDEKYVVEKIVNNEYKEIIKYKPEKNKDNKWEIPEIMKMEIK